MPEYGSASLNGSGTSLNTGNSAFRFDYSDNTFYVDGRVACKPRGNYHSFELNGLHLSANNSTFEIKPWGSYIQMNASDTVILNNDLHIQGHELRVTRLYVDGVQIKR